MIYPKKHRFSGAPIPRSPHLAVLRQTKSSGCPELLKVYFYLTDRELGDAAGKNEVTGPVNVVD